MDDTELYLSDEELEQLSPSQLEEYETHLRGIAEEWRLQPKQQRAENLTKECDIVGYGGAAGGGKSDWLLWHLYHLSLKVPKHRSLVLRRTFPELRRSLITRSLEKFDQTRCRYRPGDKEWHFDNRSVIEFGYLDQDDDVYQYKSAEYDCIAFDEATEFTEFQFDYLRSRARTAAWKYHLGARPHLIAATNPGGVGHSWFKRRFVTATNYGERVIDVEVRNPLSGNLEGVRRTAFVPATLFDNSFIDPDYKLNLMMLPDIEMRQLLYGDWDVFAGQFFAEWRQELHVIKPFAIPPSWPRVRAIDYGFAKPAACLWFALDQDHNAYGYREFYETQKTAREQAQIIVARSVMPHETRTNIFVPERIDKTVADPSIWARTGAGEPIAYQYKAEGLVCSKAMNARIDGWSRVRDYLKPDPERENQPMLRFFPTCENTIRTIPEQVFDKNKEEDLDTLAEDHAADAVRYFCMSRPRRAKVRTVAPNTLEERLAQNLERVENRRKGNWHPVMGRY